MWQFTKRTGPYGGPGHTKRLTMENEWGPNYQGDPHTISDYMSHSGSGPILCCHSDWKRSELIPAVGVRPRYPLPPN